MDEVSNMDGKGARLAIRSEEIGKVSNMEEASKRAQMKQAAWMELGNEGKKQASRNTKKHKDKHCTEEATAPFGYSCSLRDERKTQASPTGKQGVGKVSNMDEASNRQATTIDETSKIDKASKRSWIRREAANLRVGSEQDSAKASPAGEEEVGKASNVDEASEGQASNMDEASKMDDKGARLAIRSEQIGKVSNMDEASKRAWMKQATWMKQGACG